MKIDVYGLNGEKKGSVNLPNQFNEEVRKDVVKRAVQVLQSHKRQPYGALPKAGQRSSAVLSRRRKDYRGSYGHGWSRVPRKVMTKRGRQMYFVGAFAPGMKGGRRAHPPKAAKDWNEKINITERRKAIRSAMAATLNSDLVKARGHRFKELINVIDAKAENLTRTKDVISFLIKLGLQKELERVSERKVRAGKGKSRGRKYRTKVGPLFVVSGKCQLVDAASNVLGVSVINVKDLNVEALAPGANLGRLTLFTDKAIEVIEKEKLFMKKIKGKGIKK
jgi:large subunit ribosomal protein L4e